MATLSHTRLAAASCASIRRCRRRNSCRVCERSETHHVRCVPSACRGLHAPYGDTTVKSLIALAITFALVATAAAEGKITSIAVYPPDINLSTNADLQRFIVVATRDDGVTLDVTQQAAIKLADS